MWRSFLVAYNSVMKQLEAELDQAEGIPLHHYDVLVHLAEAPGRRLRMADLADRVLLSRSGLTRLVDRLEREGLVCREACTSDGRGTYTVLTDAGLERLRGASVAHLDGVRRHFADVLSDSELAALGQIMDRLIARQGAPHAEARTTV